MNNKKFFYSSGSIIISPVFVVMIVVAFSVFAFAMINLSRLPTPEEKRQASIQQMNELIIAEEAQATGMTTEEVKNQWQKKSEGARWANKLTKAIKKKDDLALANALDKLKTINLPNLYSNIFYVPTQAKNERAFRSLLKAGISCNAQSNTGAFRAAFSSANPAYLEMLLEKKCDYQAGSNQSSLEERIINSPHPEKIFQLPEIYVRGSYRDEAFLSAISKRRSKQVLTMLDLGANPNANSKRQKMNALQLSLENGMPQIAMQLIQKGAEIGVKDAGGTYALTVAIRKGYLDVAREMLRRDPDYIQRENLGYSSFVYAFLIKGKVMRRDAVTLLLQNGVQPQEFKDGGSRWLVTAVKEQDLTLVEQLLNVGIDPNKRRGMNMALSVAKSGNSPGKDKIVALLEQHGATDDLLAVIRKEKGIKSGADCKIGRIIKYKRGSIAEKHLQRSQEKPAYAISRNAGCSAVTVDCANQGFGADDCMRSVQVCGKSDTDQNVLCCDSDIQRRYFEARCSGLDVKDSARWSELRDK